MTQVVPFFGLDREFARLGPQYMGIISRVLGSGRALQGPEVADFEDKLAETCGRQFAVAVGSCTDALAFVLMALGIGPGDEVLVTGFSFFASASPILRVGATPRFVDIESTHCIMDLDRMEGLFNKRTRAIIGVHLFGQSLPMDRLEAMAADRGIPVVGDAAQGLGARDHKRPAESLGVASCLSFDPTKNLASYSSAGAVVTDDQDLAEAVRSLRCHGRNPDTGRVERLGFNSLLASDKAALLRCKLDLMSEFHNRREEVAQTYLVALKGLDGVQVPVVRGGCTHTWHKFVVQLDHRDQVASQLGKAGIQTRIHYPHVLNDEPLLVQSPGAGDALPVARSVAKRVLSLPIHSELTTSEVEHVAQTLRRILSEGPPHDA